MATREVTESDYRALILAELGQAADSALARQLTVLWSIAGGVSGGNDRLQYLRVKRAAIDFLLADAHTAVDAKEGDASESFGQVFEHLLKLATAVDEAIAMALKSGAGRRAPAVGQLNRTAPIQATDPAPPTYPLDANERAYRGDPYRVSK